LAHNLGIRRRLEADVLAQDGQQSLNVATLAFYKPRIDSILDFLDSDRIRRDATLLFRHHRLGHGS
jgi:hypothetical protein